MFGVPPTAQDFMSQAESLFDQAKADYENLELDAALENLDLAMSKLEGGAAYLTDLSLAIDILYYMGVCHAFNGEDAASEEAFLRAYVLDTSRTPDPDVFPPDVIDMFNMATAAASSIGTGSLSVGSEPQAARVYLDGLYMGVTPVTIDNVVEGKHFVRLALPGHQYYGTVTTVSAGQVAQVNANLFPAYGASKVFTLAEGLPSLLVKGVDVAAPSLGGIADQLGVQQLLLMWITATEAGSVSINVLVYDKPSGKMLAQRQGDSSAQDGALSMKGDELARAALVASVQAAAGGGGDVTIIGPPVEGGGGEEPGGEKDSVARKWWFWVALVGGAAVIGGATTAGVCLGTDACGGGGPNGPGGSGDLIFEF